MRMKLDVNLYTFIFFHNYQKKKKTAIIWKVTLEMSVNTNVTILTRVMY